MVNLKPVVFEALINSTELAQQLGTGTRIHFQYPLGFDDNNLPCITYKEEDNVGELFADDEELGANISFIIDVWGKQSISAIIIKVNEIMNGLGFYRVKSQDLYENDTQIYHKAMRFITLADEEEV